MNMLDICHITQMGVNCHSKLCYNRIFVIPLQREKDICMKTTNLYQQALLDIPDNVKREVALFYNVADRLFDLIKESVMTQKEFAKKIGKSESEVSVWMTGRHNFTLRTLAKISSVLNADIVSVPKQ